MVTAMRAITGRDREPRNPHTENTHDAVPLLLLLGPPPPYEPPAATWCGRGIGPPTNAGGVLGCGGLCLQEASRRGGPKGYSRSAGTGIPWE